jgi:hypothetical protein
MPLLLIDGADYSSLVRRSIKEHRRPVLVAQGSL